MFSGHWNSREIEEVSGVCLTRIAHCVHRSKNYAHFRLENHRLDPSGSFPFCVSSPCINLSYHQTLIASYLHSSLQPPNEHQIALRIWSLFQVFEYIRSKLQVPNHVDSTKQTSETTWSQCVSSQHGSSFSPYHTTSLLPNTLRTYGWLINWNGQWIFFPVWSPPSYLLYRTWYS